MQASRGGIRWQAPRIESASVFQLSYSSFPSDRLEESQARPLYVASGLITSNPNR
jgi:hypothetical protein